MSDFETHPVGTADQLAQLLAENARLRLALAKPKPVLTHGLACAAGAVFPQAICLLAIWLRSRRRHA